MRTLRVVLAAAALLCAFIPIAASPALAACATEQVVLYEDLNSQGHALQRCVNEPDLNQVPHTFAGMCHTTVFKLGDNWNDCISSFRVTLAANRCVRLYENSNNGGQVLATVGGPRNAQLFNFPAPFDERLSSLRFFSKVNGVCI